MFVFVNFLSVPSFLVFEKNKYTDTPQIEAHMSKVVYSFPCIKIGYGFFKY